MNINYLPLIWNHLLSDKDLSFTISEIGNIQYVKELIHHGNKFCSLLSPPTSESALLTDSLKIYRLHTLHA